MTEMKWTWDKTDGVLICGLISGIVATIMSILISACSCGFIFFSLWTISSLIYITSAYLQVSPNGKSVLVTGCDSGFGLALALLLNKQGFRVFAGCLLADNGGEGSKQLRNVKSGNLHVIQLDVTSQKQISNAVDYVKKTMPKGEVLWGLVNNAGYSTYGEIEWVPLDIYNRALQVNTVGLIAVTKAFLPLIRKAKGRVVTISSGLARFAVPMRSAYIVSKYAVEGFCDCLRYEMRSWGVKVSIIEPGNFIAGTSIFNERGIEESADVMWTQMSEEVKNDYGKKHFRSRVDLMKKYANSGDTDLSPVLHAFVEGLVQRYPQTRYNPMNLNFRTRLFVATHLPEWVHEKLYI